jgi:hypothetical protein
MAPPGGIQAYDKSLYLDHLPDGAIDVVAEHVLGKRSPIPLCDLSAW